MRLRVIIQKLSQPVRRLSCQRCNNAIFILQGSIGATINQELKHVLMPAGAGIMQGNYAGAILSWALMLTPALISSSTHFCKSSNIEDKPEPWHLTKGHSVMSFHTIALLAAAEWRAVQPSLSALPRSLAQPLPNTILTMFASLDASPARAASCISLSSGSFPLHANNKLNTPSHSQT